MPFFYILNNKKLIKCGILIKKKRERKDMNLEHFIASEFNTETVDRQVAEQEKIISRAQKKIEELKSMQMQQNEDPWYEWDGVSFYARNFDTYNHYRDRELDRTFFSNYESFVKDIILCLDSDFEYEADRDFYIVSPNKEEYKVEELPSLPLVKEYFERKELQKKLKPPTAMENVLHDSIRSLDGKIKETEKYTANYIETLQEEKEKKEKQLQELQEKRKAKNKIEIVNRISEIDGLLRCIDNGLASKRKRKSSFSW